MSTESAEVVETVEDEAAALAAFNRGLNRDRPQPTEVAADPATNDGSASDPAQVQEADELAGLPPTVRAKLEEIETLRAAAAQVPNLEHKWRSEQGRVAALQAALRKQEAAAPPPEPPRLEKVERVRAELPEVIEAMEEYFQSRQPQKVEAQPDAEAPLLILGEEAPDWEQTVTGMPFQQWIATQDPAYREKVNKTNSEAVMLAAIIKFDAHQQITTERQAAAQKAAQIRQARVAAAVVPNGSGSRAPSGNKTAEDWFQDGLRRRHRQ